MSSAEGAGSRRRRRAAEAAAPAGARPIRRGLAPVDWLTAEQVAQIEAASFQILETVGVRVTSPEAVELFRRAGAKVEADEQRLYLHRALVQEALRTAPREYTLHARNPLNEVVIGGDNCALMPAGGPPYVRDLAGVRRPGTMADFEALTKLSALSPEIQVLARKVVEAQDVPVATRHLECWRTALVLGDKPITSGFVGGRPEAEDVLQMLAAVFGGEAALDGRPVAQCNMNVNSPLLFDRAMVEGLLAFARWGQPVIVTPFVMAGVMGPATLAGALAQHNAEVLAGVTLTQLVRPGTPVVYGTATSNVDLRSGAPATGSPESALAVAVAAQFARHYGLPCRGGGALTDSPLPDAQSNYERMMVLLTSVLSGVHFMLHGAGSLESYLTVDFEQFVIDLELIAMLRELVRPLEITPDTLALEAIAEVGPGGFFLDKAHTLQHYRQAHFLPNVSVRQPYDQWLAAGAHDAAARANARCRELLESYVEPAMESAARARLEDFVERRKGELLSSP